MSSHQDLPARMSSCVSVLQQHVDLSSSCGFLSLVTLPGLASKVQEQEREEVREGSPAGAELDSSTAQLLEEELDNIDCPLAGGLEGSQHRLEGSQQRLEGSQQPHRPQVLSLQGLEEQQEGEWQVLDLTFGVPLFDMDLNKAVTDRITGRDLVCPASLAALAESSSRLGDRLQAFIREMTEDYVPYVTAMVEETEVPFPTRSALVNRPGGAGAVLQSPLLLIHCLIHAVSRSWSWSDLEKYHFFILTSF